MKYKPGEPVPPWRVGEFKSSASPDKLVLVLCVGPDIRPDGEHPDFIRWVGGSDGVNASDKGAPK